MGRVGRAEATPAAVARAADPASITDTFEDLLVRTRYFDVLDERVQGWPQSDPQHRYGYGTWWSGAGFDKSQGNVSLVHVNVGADHNGIGTSAVLESVCVARGLWPTPMLEQLLRRLVRGFNAWMLAMERSPNDTGGPLLARTAYPASITSTDNGRTVFIDYSADRPGLDSYTQYVHLPTNGAFNGSAQRRPAGFTGVCTCRPGEEQPCSGGQGECHPGRQTCQPDRTWAGCTGEGVASPEPKP